MNLRYLKTSGVIVYIILISLSSCATILNKSTQNITVHTKGTQKVIIGKDTLVPQKNKIRLTVNRSKNPLNITLLKDSVFQKTEIQSGNSFAYYSNIYFNSGIGMLVERKNPKRFGYPSAISLNTDEIPEIYSLHQLPKKGSTNLNLVVPYINNFSLQPKGEGNKSSTGFMGIGIGMDYYYNNNQFLNISTGAAMDFPLPFFAPIDHVGNYEVMGSMYVNVTNNHHFNRFTVGYGIGFSRNFWNLNEGIFDNDKPMRDAVHKNNSALGLVFSSHYRIGQKFNIGLTYRPSPISLTDNQTFLYEHMLSLELVWKFRIRK